MGQVHLERGVKAHTVGAARVDARVECVVSTHNACSVSECRHEYPRACLAAHMQADPPARGHFLHKQTQCFRSCLWYDQGPSRHAPVEAAQLLAGERHLRIHQGALQQRVASTAAATAAALSVGYKQYRLCCLLCIGPEERQWV